MDAKSSVLGVYLPVVLGFFVLVAGGTCLGVGPFFPVGLAGLVSWLAGGYGIWCFVRERKAKEAAERLASYTEDRAEAEIRRWKSDYAKLSNELVEAKAQVAAAKAEKEEKIKKEMEAVMAEPVKKVKKAKKASS